jgi:hypothetical protein
VPTKGAVHGVEDGKIPDDHGELVFRVVGPGQVEEAGLAQPRGM